MSEERIPLPRPRCRSLMGVRVLGTGSYVPDVASGASDLALVVGGDCNSRIVNPHDIKTYPLFGDGAGAALLARGRPDQGLIRYSLGSDGSGGDLLSRPAGGSRMKLTPEV